MAGPDSAEPQTRREAVPLTAAIGGGTRAAAAVGTTCSSAASGSEDPVRARVVRCSGGLVHTAGVSEVFVVEESFDSPMVQRLLAEWNDQLGFVPKGGATVEAGDFAPPDGIFLLAALGEAPVGCGGLRRLALATGEIKRLFVRRAARGHGVGRVLLDGLEQWARQHGFGALRLDTDGGEPAALALFRSAGYQPIDDYNGNPHARYWFEKRLAAPCRGA